MNVVKGRETGMRLGRASETQIRYLNCTHWAMLLKSSDM